MTECALVSSPMVTSTASSENDTLLSEPTEFRTLIGGLQYLTISRPDIAYSVNTLSQHLKSPSKMHLTAAKRLLRYIKGTLHYGIMFRPGPLTISAFSDADWASCIRDRKSTTGSCIFIGTTPVAWTSRKQQTVARSSTEAEFRALASTVSDLSWICYILRDLGIRISAPPTLLCDNLGALAIARNPVHHGRTRHIEVDFYFIREFIARGAIQAKHVSSENQVADILRKPLPVTTLRNLIVKLSLIAD